MAPPERPEELADDQRRREQTEHDLADEATDEREARAHERRAEQAGYLRAKLAEQAEADR